MPSLIEAIKEKYCDDDDVTSANDGMICQFVTFKRNETNFVETPPIPPVVALNKYNIEHVGDENEVNEMIKDVKELDLAYNELRDWVQIHKLLNSTPRLQFLNLSFNDLSEPIETPSIFLSQEIPIFSTLSTLILIGTSISWNSIGTLIQRMVQLQELHLSKNNFSTIDLEIPKEPMNVELKRFIFNENPIENWDHINKIGKFFPNLEYLGLSETLISSIDPSSYENFPKLQSLSVSSTKINEMDHITHLRQFPSLTELRIQGALIFSDLTTHERRQLTVALLPNITKLNGTIITDSERDASERAFIRYFDQLHLEGNLPDRYIELKEIHGKLDPLVSIDLKPVTELNLKFIFGEQTIVKKVKVHQTTTDLKIYAKKLFGLEQQRIRLYYNDVAMCGSCSYEEEMRYPQKYLYSYNPNEDDEILIALRT